jgi:hypothetical protein
MLPTGRSPAPQGDEQVIRFISQCFVVIVVIAVPLLYCYYIFVQV